MEDKILVVTLFNSEDKILVVTILGSEDNSEDKILLKLLNDIHS